MSSPGGEGSKMSSPHDSDSDNDLFNPVYRPTYETVETLPLQRIALDDDDDSEHETLATLPLHTSREGTQNGNTHRFTQPTQIIRRSPPHMASPNPKPIIQVAASSPIPSPIQPRRESGFLASAMAPAGTAFRRPFVPPQPPRQVITIESDDEGPTYRGGSSDEDPEELKKNDIKITNFQRKNSEASGNVPESPARGNSLFKKITSHAIYNEPSNGVKRSSDGLANAYGSVYKKPRQVGPSRAMPVTQQQPPELDINDIDDYNTRQKVKRMLAMLSQTTVRECYDMLIKKRGFYDDAMAELLDRQDLQHNQQKKGTIDLTGSDDELMPTPAGQRRQNVNPVRQQAKAPQKSIAEKWSSTQHLTTAAPKRLNVFDTPIKKSRTLIRGRKDRSSPPMPDVGESHTTKPALVLSDDSDEADSGIHSDRDDNSLQDRVLTFFNTCTAADLADTAAIKPNLAAHIVSNRPFKSLTAVKKVEAPDLKPRKSNRKAPPVGERIAEKVEEMIESYEAVDYLVKQCENIAKPLAAEMNNWGIHVHGSQMGELEIVSLPESQISNRDSGIGTPVSDDDRDISKKSKLKKYISQPSIMSDDLRLKDYQVVGINWLNLLYQKKLSCILADDMGLGKTCQVIAFLAHLLEMGEKGPHLIVVPAATLENWLKEFNRFCPALKVEPYYSTNPSERESIRASLEDARDEVNVIITTYTLAKGKEDSPWLRTFGFTCTIFDEGHILKNADSMVSRKLVRIQSRFRLLLTGTPLQNNLRELISLLGFLMPSLFHEKSDELQAIFNHHVKAMDDNHEALLSAQRIARARSMLIPFILRRKKFQVLKDLPKKERRVEICEMTPEQAEIYQTWLEKAYSIRERRQNGELLGMETTNILMRLRQAAIHPFLFRRLYEDKQLPVIAKQCLKDEMWSASNPDLIVTELTEYSDMEIHKLCDEHAVLQRFALNDHEWLASGKVRKMLDLVRNFMAQGHRTLIFSQFVMVLDILELVLEREAIAYFRLDGNTKVSERQDLIDEFCDDDNQTPVFMLSTKAGGAGINLAKANKVIVFDSGFNPQDDIQAENRAHRIGQVKEVEVIRLVSKGTVEEQIYAMGLTKLKLDEQVAGDGSDETGQQATGKSDGEEDDADKETEGRNMVTEMFFKKLDKMPKAEFEKQLQDSVMEKDEPASSEEAESQKTEIADDGLDTTSAAKVEDEAVVVVEKREGSAELPSRPRRKGKATVKPRRG